MNVPNEHTAPSPIQDKQYREWVGTTTPKVDYAMGNPGQYTSPAEIVPYPGTDTKDMAAGNGTMPINERGRT